MKGTAEKSKQQKPVLALLSRYRSVTQAAWQHRTELAGPSRMADEIAFLPSALSLQETPPHPAPRRLAWTLMALFLAALIWSIVGEVDIVAVAPGRIIVSDRTKVIQPLEVSVVRRVLVKDGDRVKVGQVLVQLDPTIASADKANVEEQLSAAISEEQRTAVILDALVHGAKNIDQERVEGASNRLQLLSEWQEIGAKLAKHDAEAALRRAEMNTVQASVAKLDATIPMARERESDFKKLVGNGYMSGHATQDKTRERIEMERDLATERARLATALSALKDAEQSKNTYRTEALRMLNDRNAAATTRHFQLKADHRKADQREQLTVLRAPVDGVVQQLAIHTTGGVVTEAQPLMIVVPDTAQVTAEVSVANQDIGFVNAGQVVEVKLETFPYTKYGTVPAKVTIVTADAVTDEKKGSYYPATLEFSKKDMLIDGKLVALSPGMNITAEIKTGHRRIIEYMLSPIQRATDESLRER